MKHLLNESILFDCANQIEPFKCKMCPKFQTNLVVVLRHHFLNGHRRDNWEAKIYTCLRCSFLTFSRYLHIRHRLFRKCEEEKKKGQFVCYRGDGTAFTLKEEPTTSTQENCEDTALCDPKPGPCINSEAKTPGQSNPEDVQWFNCEQCPLRFKDYRNFKRHVRLQHSTPEELHWFKCEQCPSKFKRREHLKTHITNCHNKPNAIIHCFECMQCHSTFNRNSNLKRHVMSCHSKPEDIHYFKCDQCPSTFKQREYLKTHVKFCHAKPEDIRWFKCDPCGSKYKRNKDLKKHVRKHHSKAKSIN